MPGFVVTAPTVVACAHGGQAKPSSAAVGISIMGQPVVVQSASYVVAGCPFAPGGTPTPCISGAWSSAAQRVRARGAALLLVDSQGKTAPNGVPLMITPLQTRVSAQ